MGKGVKLEKTGYWKCNIIQKGNPILDFLATSSTPYLKFHALPPRTFDYCKCNCMIFFIWSTELCFTRKKQTNNEAEKLKLVQLELSSIESELSLDVRFLMDAIQCASVDYSDAQSV